MKNTDKLVFFLTAGFPVCLKCTAKFGNKLLNASYPLFLFVSQPMCMEICNI